MDTEVWKDVPGEPGYIVSSQGRVAKVVGKRTVNGYKAVSFPRPGNKCKSVFTHRVVMAAFVGPAPAGMDVNHKNGVRHDNRLDNLEYATRADNNLHRYRVLGRHGPGRRLTSGQVEAVRLSAGEISEEVWADTLGVSRGCIHRIRKGLVYREAPGPIGTKKIYHRGGRHHKARLNDELVQHIRADIGTSSAALARRLGVSQTAIDHARQGRTWKHVGGPVRVCISSRGELHSQAKLRETEVAEIRSALAAGESQRSVAGRYGVSRSLVGLIGQRKVWAHVE